MAHAVGFYWTLPVPWTGFTRLPKQVDEAAKVSKTIRYQRDLIRRYALAEHYELIHEEVFLEIEPDRGSDFVIRPLMKAKAICQRQNASLLLVDFWQVQQWRAHFVLKDWLQESGIEVRFVYPDEIPMDGQSFNPHVHFNNWREVQKEWTARKQERIDRARDRARELLEEGKSFSDIAAALNAERVQSSTGRPWKADNLRRFMKGRGAG